MSYNENLNTRDILEGHANFRIWKKELFVLLMQEDLLEYILKEKLIKKDGSTLSNADKKKSIAVLGQTDIYYAIGTKEEDILKDARVRNIIIRSVSTELIEDIDFYSLSSYEIYHKIIETCLGTEEERRNEIKNYLNNTKFDPEGDKPISIFISKFKQRFRELEELKVKLSVDDKFDYLYRAMPIDLVMGANMLQYRKDLDVAIKNLIKTYNKLKELCILDEICGDRNNKNNKNNTSTVKVQINYNQTRTKNNDNSNKSRKDVECSYCGKKGHYKRECWNRKTTNDKRKKKNYNNKK